MWTGEIVEKETLDTTLRLTARYSHDKGNAKDELIEITERDVNALNDINRYVTDILNARVNQLNRFEEVAKSSFPATPEKQKPVDLASEKI